MGLWPPPAPKSGNGGDLPEDKRDPTGERRQEHKEFLLTAEGHLIMHKAQGIIAECTATSPDLLVREANDQAMAHGE